MTKTENYNLNQWDPEDRVIHTDFNDDNAKIDAALHALEQGKVDAATLASLQTSISNLQTALNQAYSPSNKCFVTGNYVGDGAATRVINLGFKPSAIFLFASEGFTYDNGVYIGGLSLPGWGTYSGLSVVTNGFQVSSNSTKYHSNDTAYRYYYVAFR